jgi:DNA-3-methyladenine glycosylase
MVKLEQKFYDRADVVQISRELLGKILITKFDGIVTSGRIVEVEAYAGEKDKASHAFGGRRTNRTSVIYYPGGTAYVYLCYGIHHLFNIVTNKKDIPHAILIRGVEPLEGIPAMLERTHKKKLDYTLTRGPGNVSKALGIGTKHTGGSLLEDEIYVASDGFVPKKEDILATPRIGVDYAGEDALLPYRFIIKGNKYVSGNNK